MGLLRLLVATLAVTCAVLSPPVAANRSVSWQKGQVVDAYRRAAKPHLRESRENSRYKDLMVAVQRTRKRVKCRDSDIIIVSHPKSGTHWLASVLSKINVPEWTTESARDNDLDLPSSIFAKVPPMQRFHGFPIYWLLPGTSSDNSVVPDAVYEAVEAVPEGVPRIFLSHMPAEFFEYEPTPSTKIFYLMREPHAVWASVVKFMSRAVRLWRNLHKLEDQGAAAAATIDLQSLEFKRVDVEDLTLDYIRGEVALPPRGRDQGRPFAWNQHVLGWWQKLKSDEYTGVVVDFDQAISEAAAAVEKLIALCRPQDLGDPYKALAVLQQASYSSTRDSIGQSNIVKAYQTMVHFPSKPDATSENSPNASLKSWTPLFFEMHEQIRTMFNDTHTGYDRVMNDASASAKLLHDMPPPTLVASSSGTGGN
eukprot:INCI13444.3.p1 GENE.INCI13444.3~~INCI13444.3.p1  ORF type:complete len:423 (-),score=48.49 INCI13444.3:1008-2276(-)